MIGQKLSDRYEITGEVGRGGMGVVYRARDPLLNREVAIKLIPPSLLSADGEQRFQREAQLVAQMDHPSIVPVHDFGRHETSLFFVMPLVQGANLHAFLQSSALLGDVLDIGIQVAEALEYSHRHGVVHRDIKPDNIMVARDSGGVRTRVMDFGLARAATEARLTKSGAMVGTLYYLSPEQITARDVDARSDIYSLGTVLYECVVGSPPFSGDTEAVLYRIAHELPQPPRSLGAEIDDELEQLILACLSKEPGRRPQTAGEVAEALKRYRARLRDTERSRTLGSLTRTHQTLRPALQPFVGRAKEFAELQQRLNAAVAGECQFAVVAGEAGIGKTRLLDELGNLARARKIRVLHGRTADQDRAFPYQGFCDLIQEFFRQREDASAPPPDLSDVAADLVALFPMLNEISEIREATGGASPSRAGAAGAEDRTQVFELLARTLTRVAAGRPLVLMLEDLHAAEVSIEALQYIFRRLGPTPTLIVGTYRSTEVGERHPLLRVIDGFRGDRRFSATSLGPFSASDHRSFIETIVGGSHLSDSLVHRIFDATKGNPFFTRELVRSLLDAGGISKDDTGEWNLSGEAGIATDVLPATIQQAVETRVQRLPDEVREILGAASVIGRTFDARDLEALAEGRGDVEDALDVLLREGLVEEERESRGDLLAFSSGVVRDVLYAGLSRRKRRGLHRRYAELLETRHAGRRDRVLPQLMHHFSQGDVPDKTVEYGLRLARTSLDSWSAEEAVRSARTALEFLDDEWEGDRTLEGEARTLQARAHRMAGNIDAALKEADNAVRVFEREGMGERAVGALLLGAETAWQARRSEETSRWVDRGLLAARAAGDAESLRQLLSLAATLANLMGEYAKAGACLEEAASLAPEPKESAAPEAIRSGGRLVVALANDVGTIEPTAIETTEELEISANVYEALLATDVRGNVVPNLCEKWEPSDGGRTFLLTLRRDVRFSDGAPVTAADVKASFETCIRQAGREFPPAYAAIEGAAELRAGKANAALGVVVRGDDRLEIRLREPLAIYPALLTAGTGVARSAPGASGAGMRLLGTGPFQLASQDRQSIVLERNSNYWRGASTPLDAVEFRAYPNATAIAKAFRAGEIDVARDLLPADLEEILRDSRLRRGLVEAAKRNTYVILFNSRSGPLARHGAARRALVGVVRTSDLVWRTLGRFAQPAVSLVPPGMLGHDPGRRARLSTVEDAREALQAAHLEPPLRLRLSVQPLFQDRYGALLNALLPLWSDLGVEVEITTTDMASYLATWEANENIDVLIGRWNADYDDPDNFTHTLFHSQSGLWRAWFSSAEADRLIEEARAESRPAVREGLYRKFESLLQDAAVLVPLFHDVDYRLAGPRVRGLSLRGTAPFVNYPHIGKADEVEPEAEPVRAGGGILHVPIAGIVTTLDPARADTVENAEVSPSVFETLTRDAGGARFVPWLAAHFGMEMGGRRYRFRLRDDVRFHDGRPLTARDVRYSFERMLQQPRNDVRWQFSLIEGARALLNGLSRDLVGFRIDSAREFTIDLEEPVAYFPALTGHPAGAIVPEGCDPSTPAGWVGTGPYRVVAFEPGRRLELERNRAYWRKGYPKNDGLVFNFGLSPKEVLTGFRAGRFSLASDLVPSDVEALRRDPEYASGYRETPGLLTYFLALNTRSGPLQDRDLRQRLLGCIDVPRLVRQTLGRLALPAVSLIPPGLVGHGQASSRTEAVPDSGAAPPPGLELTAAVHPLFFAGYAAFARELTATLSGLGIRIRVVNKTMDEMNDAQRDASVDLNLARWVADYPDADTFIRTVHTREGHLGRLCGSPEVDRLIERGRAEPVPSLRHGLYREAEEILARDARLLPLFHEQAYRLPRPEVEGLAVSFGFPSVSYEELRIRA
ncbi:MAG TPA: ABC transporter substrate-binding protein [Vicinamibacteria bacterium]|nr:ABC transporter substrate-binding protein [Vicinamibacteria bacterium]